MAEELKIPSEYRRKPEKLGDEYLMHVTTRSNVEEIIRRGAIVPLNVILEETPNHTPSSEAWGLDAARGESSYKSLEEHKKELKKCGESLPEAGEYAKRLWPVYADMKLGRKRDFVYATMDKMAVEFYTYEYADKKKIAKTDLFVLRWKPGKEEYFIDLQDTKALKTSSSIGLDRLEIANLEDAIRILPFGPLSKTKLVKPN